MKVDPEATLRCWGVDVEIGGKVYAIPALPARDWVLAVLDVTSQGLSGPLPGVVPGLIADDELADAIADGEVSSEECARAARAAVEAASGTRWWTAIRVAHSTAGTDIGAELTARGVDPGVIPFGAYLAAAYRVATREATDVDRAKVDAALEAPPAGLPAEEWFGEADTTATFAAAMAATAGR